MEGAQARLGIPMHSESDLRKVSQGFDFRALFVRSIQHRLRRLKTQNWSFSKLKTGVLEFIDLLIAKTVFKTHNRVAVTVLKLPSSGY